MTFIDAIKTCFKKYADFSGRARRSEFWFWTLFTFLVSSAISFVFGDNYDGSPSAVSSIFSLAVLVPSLAVGWRRCHDIDRSGAYYLTIMIPFYNIYTIIVLCRDSDPYNNEYGPSPKYGPPSNLVPPQSTVALYTKPGAPMPGQYASQYSDPRFAQQGNPYQNAYGAPQQNAYQTPQQYYDPAARENRASVCPSCGKPYIEGSAFCEYCGAKLR